MWFAPMLKLRDQISRKRNVLLEDEEKPFLDHLEDLRKMLMRIILTLLVSVTLCFVFNKWFFDVIQYPMVRAGLASAQEKNVPAGLTADQWRQIHTAARGASVLEGPAREIFLSKALKEADLRPWAEVMVLYHTADMLPAELQEAYLLETAALLPEPMRARAAEAARGILAVRPQSSLDALKPVIETEAFAPAETFMLSMKLSMFAGIIVSFPLLFYFLLEFVLPGLNPRERKLLWPALSIGFGLFLMGVFFAYYFVIPNALEFFHEYSHDLGIRDGWRIGNYISFVTSFCLIFGVSFELPVVVMILVKLELLTSATMRRTRAWAIIIIVSAGAILTPTGDIFTLSLLAGPMIIMYEICIWLALAMERKNARLEAEEAQRDMARRAALVGVATVAATRPGSSPGGGSADTPSGGLSRESTDPETAGSAGRDPGGSSTGPENGEGGETAGGGADGHWGSGHPHHADEPAGPSAEYEQYMREHAHLFPAADTHPENTPVEERTPGAPPAAGSAPDTVTGLETAPAEPESAGPVASPEAPELERGTAAAGEGGSRTTPARDGEDREGPPSDGKSGAPA